jgi:hypothetical protein
MKACVVKAYFKVKVHPLYVGFNTILYRTVLDNGHVDAVNCTGEMCISMSLLNTKSTASVEN